MRIFIKFCVAANRSLRFSVRRLRSAHFLIGRKFMDKMKINKKGQITIPKYIRDKYGLKDGISMKIYDYDGELRLKPVNFCYTCGKALPDGTPCPNCPPRDVIHIY